MFRIIEILSPGPYGPDNKRGINGPEKKTIDIIKCWNKKGYKTILFYPQDGALYKEFNNIVEKIIDISFKNSFDVLTFFRLIIYIIRNKADVIHVQGPITIDAYAIMLGLLTNTPVFVTRLVIVEDMMISPIKKIIFKSIDRILLPKSTLVSTITKRNLNSLNTYIKVPRDKLILIYNGVELVSSKYKKNKYNSAVLLMVASLTPRKGWPDFLQMISILKKQNKNVIGLCAGNGPLYSQLKKLTLELNIKDNVKFLGYRDDLGPIYSDSEIFVLSSYSEGLSMAVLEAMSNGLPIVLTDVGGAREQVKDNYNGLIVQPYAPEKLAEKVLKIISDRKLKDYMGKNSKKIIKKYFSKTKMLKSYSYALERIFFQKN